MRNFIITPVRAEELFTKSAGTRRKQEERLLFPGVLPFNKFFSVFSLFCFYRFYAAALQPYSGYFLIFQITAPFHSFLDYLVPFQRRQVICGIVVQDNLASARLGTLIRALHPVHVLSADSADLFPAR